MGEQVNDRHIVPDSSNNSTSSTLSTPRTTTPPEGQTRRVYRNDPYSKSSGRVEIDSPAPSSGPKSTPPDTPPPRTPPTPLATASDHAPVPTGLQATAPTPIRPMAIVASTTPQPLIPGTLHGRLHQRVSFVPFPASFAATPPPPAPSGELTRVFLGQFPYGITDSMLNWLFSTFGGAPLYHPERITKRDISNARTNLPTGCLHAACDASMLPQLIQTMHKRILFDDTGLWYAQNPQQVDILAQYCQQMKAEGVRPFKHRPYGTVVIQSATSEGPHRKNRDNKEHQNI